jgi:hypothetical protein
MTTMAATDRGETGSALPREALVLGVEEDRILARTLPDGGEIRARVAVVGYSPAEGDRVLLQRADGGAAYVLGVVHAPRATAASISTPSGARAEVEGDRIALRDAEGRLLLTLDGATGEIAIVSDKDLRLAAPAGRVVVEASAMSLSVGHYELSAERIVERTAEAFRTVEGLLETRAKHLRTVVARTLELYGRRTTIASEEDTRVDGRRVLLG